ANGLGLLVGTSGGWFAGDFECSCRQKGSGGKWVDRAAGKKRYAMNSVSV
nr:hypothetical protein [Tanacetum cinerariifolium]